jgi:3-dehydroquinate dehydratase
MSVVTRDAHEFWGTVSGAVVDEIQEQVAALAEWGVSAIEIRLDLVPRDLWPAVLEIDRPSLTFCIAHFGLGESAREAADALEAAFHADVDGLICHSHYDDVPDVASECRRSGKLFAAAYHRQQPLTKEQALREFIAQEERSPSFAKIAVRAQTHLDVLALLQATVQAARSSKLPVVSAVFGPHRWARIALPHCGSAITFVVARHVQNEVGGDDEQFTLDEMRALQSVRRLIPIESALATSEA